MAPGRQLALLWAGVALACVGGLTLTPVLAPDLLPDIAAGIPACPVKSVVGLPCPSCGATRATVALSELDPATALALNPLVVVGWVTLVVGGFWAGSVALAGRELPAAPRRLSSAWRWGTVVLLAANWIYLVGRGV